MVSFLERQVEKVCKELKIPFLFVRFKDGVVNDSYFPSYDEARLDFDRLYLSDLLKRNKGNKSRSAMEAELSRDCLYKKLNKANIEEDSRIFELKDIYAFHSPIYRDVLRHFEVFYLHHLIVRSQGDCTTAARIAGMSRFGMLKHFKAYGIPLEDYRWMDWPSKTTKPSLEEIK